MTEVTDKMVESALPAFWRETEPYITMRERMRAAIEAALSARDPVNDGEIAELVEALRKLLSVVHFDSEEVHAARTVLTRRVAQ